MHPPPTRSPRGPPPMKESRERANDGLGSSQGLYDQIDGCRGEEGPAGCGLSPSLAISDSVCEALFDQKPVLKRRLSVVCLSVSLVVLSGVQRAGYGRTQASSEPASRNVQIPPPFDHPQRS
jgi:hypothetical protein